jgi:formylglycine-generating enzyme required for sulfatase activity
MSNLATLAVLERQHKGRPAGECVAARIDELKKVALTLPPPTKAYPPGPVVIPPVPLKAEPAAGVFNPSRPAKPLTPAEERALKSGDSFRECDECPEMVVVPAGEFMMGSEEFDSEKPSHKVSIRRPYAVGKYEVTFAEWEACVAEGGCRGNLRPDDKGWGRGRRPVINISWHDAKEYVTWVSRKAGNPYRLPSEAEWEYAARAGTTTRYAFGNAVNRKLAHYSEGARGSAGKTMEVGSFPANGFGLHDMHGNVWEWCEDSLHSNYEGAPDDGSAWAGGDASHRIIRGGAWLNNHDRDLRSAHRNKSAPAGRFDGIGFRVARTL